MNHLELSKRLFKLLIAGTISFSSINATIAKASTVTGKVAYTGNIANVDDTYQLKKDSPSGFIVLDSIGDVMREFESYEITEAVCKAVTIKEANVRSGPGTEYDRLTVLKKGKMVEVLARTNNGWYLIYNDGEMYFTIGTNIQILSVTYENGYVQENIPPIVEAIKPTVNLNVRAEPKKESEKLGMISGNRTYKVLERLDNGWIKIDYRGMEAYVMAKYTEDTLMIDGPFYNFIYLKRDSYLLDQNGNVIREVSCFEGGKVYYETEDIYLVSLGDDYGYLLKKDCSVVTGRFVNIDLSLQELEIIDTDSKEVLLVTDVITGKDSSPSDIGLFQIYSIRHDTYLTSDTYSVHVDHFAGYNGGEGMHDAKWQNGNFGKVDYYHKGGSHGCINMPPEVTPEVFQLLKIKMNVLVHK